MSRFTRGAIDEIRKALTALDEEIERARKALDSGDVQGAQAALSAAVNFKYEALYFFPDVIVNERETIPFSRVFALLEGIERLIVVLRGWPKREPYDEPSTIEELVRRLKEKLEELQRLRDKSWIEGKDDTDPADYLDRMIQRLRRYIAAAEAIQRGETPEFPDSEDDWAMLFLDLVGDEDPLGGYFLQLGFVDWYLERAKWDLSHEAPGDARRRLDLAEANKHRFLDALLRIRVIEKPPAPPEPGSEDLPPIPPDHV